MKTEILIEFPDGVPAGIDQSYILLEIELQLARLNKKSGDRLKIDKESSSAEAALGDAELVQWIIGNIENIKDSATAFCAFIKAISLALNLKGKSKKNDSQEAKVTIKFESKKGRKVIINLPYRNDEERKNAENIVKIALKGSDDE